VEETRGGNRMYTKEFNTIFAYFPEQQIAIAMQINADNARKNMSLMDYVLHILNNISVN